jgi:hypothetical protein
LNDCGQTLAVRLFYVRREPKAATFPASAVHGANRNGQTEGLCLRSILVEPSRNCCSGETTIGQNVFRKFDRSVERLAQQPRPELSDTRWSERLHSRSVDPKQPSEEHGPPEAAAADAASYAQLLQPSTANLPNYHEGENLSTEEGEQVAI